MRNLLLDQYATADIDQFVGKVLSDLGNPDPPLKLAEVRELLRLGKAFYSSTHDSAIREVAHKLKVAGQPVLARPTILKDIIGKLGLKALLLPDRRRILIDSEVPGQKQRWSEAHQIGHDVIPWHADTMLGDNKSTLHHDDVVAVRGAEPRTRRWSHQWASAPAGSRFFSSKSATVLHPVASLLWPIFRGYRSRYLCRNSDVLR